MGEWHEKTCELCENVKIDFWRFPFLFLLVREAIHNT